MHESARPMHIISLCHQALSARARCLLFAFVLFKSGNVFYDLLLLLLIIRRVAALHVNLISVGRARRAESTGWFNQLSHKWSS